MRRYVWDATAFVYVWREATVPLPTIESIARFVEDERIVFCDEVVDELERIGDESLVFMVRKMKGDRADPGAPYSVLRRVLQLPGLVDEDADGEEAGPSALAQALHLQERGEEVALVTDDVYDKPTRLSVAAGCKHFDIEWMLPWKCLESLSEADLLH